MYCICNWLLKLSGNACLSISTLSPYLSPCHWSSPPPPSTQLTPSPQTQIPSVAVDYYYFGRLLVAPLNIVLYNVFGKGGPDLYGTEKFSYYIFNGILNFNILFPFALLGTGMGLVKVKSMCVISHLESIVILHDIVCSYNHSSSLTSTITLTILPSLSHLTYHHPHNLTHHHPHNLTYNHPNNLISGTCCR